MLAHPVNACWVVGLRFLYSGELSHSNLGMSEVVQFSVIAFVGEWDRLTPRPLRT